jgi:hypothetical protein
LLTNRFNGPFASWEAFACLNNLKPGFIPGFSCCLGSRHFATILQMNTLTACSAAYIAGLVDADGTITVTRKHINENRHPALTISNTDRYLLKFVLETVGAGKITAKRTTADNHTPSFAFAIYNRQALELIRQLRPFLRTYKAKRSDLILNDYLKLTPRNGKYSKEALRARKCFEERVLAIKPAM